MSALETWKRAHPPDNPSAWLYRVAKNNLLGTLRQRSRRHHLQQESEAANSDLSDPEFEVLLPQEIADDLLRMLFVSCDASIPIESQLVLALKTLCGLDVREIALRLFTTEASVYKRLSRARHLLREVPEFTLSLNAGQVAVRLPSVHTILYLLFTEGYLSAHADVAIRRELCTEAIRLATLLAEHPLGQAPETFALVALMHLHFARLTARQDASGGLLLLEEQDRAQWDREQIAVGLGWLALSAQGQMFSRYHAEAGIAAEHGLSSSFEATRWDRVSDYYALLEHVAPSALHRLNRAVAVAEGEGPEAGLAVLTGFKPPTWLAGSYQWAAVLADLHRRCGHVDVAARYRDSALELAPTPAVRDLLQRRLGGAR